MDNVIEEKVNDVTFKAFDYDNHNRLKKATFIIGGETQEYSPIYEKTPGNIFTEQVDKDNYANCNSKLQ